MCQTTPNMKVIINCLLQLDMSSNDPLTDNIDITNFNNEAAIFNEVWI